MRNNLIWITGIVVILAGILLAGIYGPDEVWKGVLWGSLISCFLNFLGFFAVRYSFTRSFKLLLSSIVAGLLVKMTVVLVSAVYFRQSQSISIMWYLISFVACIFIYQAMEISFFYSRGKALKTDNS